MRVMEKKICLQLLLLKNQSMYQTSSDNAKYVDRVYKVEDLSPNLIRKNWKST